MIIESIWLTKLVLSHLLTDFVLQPKSWVKERSAKHAGAATLYLHGTLTGLVAWIMIGWQYWMVGLVILVSHTLIDLWKSYQKQTTAIFIADQLLHLMVIVACWYFTFLHWPDVQEAWIELSRNEFFWKVITGFVFLTLPASILIGQVTRKWRDKLQGSENLAEAGKWIGIVERTIIFVFVLQNQFEAIGLLIAAKAIIRYNEKDRPEIKTEYLVVGTLMSITLAIMTGLAIRL